MENILLSSPGGLYINFIYLLDIFNIRIHNTSSLGCSIALSHKTVTERMFLYIDLFMYPVTQKHPLLMF